MKVYLLNWINVPYKKIVEVLKKISKRILFLKIFLFLKQKFNRATTNFHSHSALKIELFSEAQNNSSENNYPIRF